MTCSKGRKESGARAGKEVGDSSRAWVGHGMSFHFILQSKGSDAEREIKFGGSPDSTGSACVELARATERRQFGLSGPAYDWVGLPSGRSCR